MSSAAKMNTLDMENKKPMSKNCLFEKLDNHVKKLVEEIEEKTSDFQKSFQSLLTSMNACRVQDPCESMQDYFNRIQELNKHFDDLENKSSNFVENICRLRIKSLLIDGLKESDDEHEPLLITETPQLWFVRRNLTDCSFEDNLTPIDDTVEMDPINDNNNEKSIETKNNINEKTSQKEGSHADNEDQFNDNPILKKITKKKFFREPLKAKGYDFDLYWSKEQNTNSNSDNDSFSN